VAGLGLGALGLAAALLVIATLLSTWRLGERAASHRISLLGRGLSYPSANAAAILVLALALLGLAATVTAVLTGSRELALDFRLRRSLNQLACGAHGDAVVIDDDTPRAFCAGLLNPRVYISTGALASLDPQALAAVVAHERQHRARHDPLRFAAGRVISASLFCLPGIRKLLRHQRPLAELGADRAAAELHGRAALARAMLAFADHDHAGVDAARVDYLLGRRPGPGFPALLCACALSAIVVLAAVALLAARVAVGSATLAVPFISRQPCVVVLALIFAALLVIGGYLARRD
jgi:Zn-dependent protease with chaperone function